MTGVQPIAAVRTAPARTWDDRWLVHLGLCGVLSAVSLIAATVVGGVLRDGYDPVRDAISQLTEAGRTLSGPGHGKHRGRSRRGK
jgi:hypothetical protein